MKGLLDFALISSDKKLIASIEGFCHKSNYMLISWNNESAFLDAQEAEAIEAKFIMVSDLDSTTKDSLAQKVQVASQMCPNSFICCVVGQKMPKEEASFVIKSGADVMMTIDEVTTTSKLEYICNNVIRSDYIPIKTSDLEQDKELTFNVYYYVGQRNKFLICGHDGLVLSADKFEKMKKLGEFYIKRSDVDKFNTYVKTLSYNSETAVERRCRSEYLSLCWSYTEFIILLTDYSRFNSFTEGKALLDKCKTFSNRLISSMAAVNDLWKIINQRVINISSLDNIPAVTAYAGLFALQMEIENVEDVMLAALLSDISLIFQPPETIIKLKTTGVEKLSAEEQARYKEHPVNSLKIALDRKVPINNNIREILLCTHERADGNGFPKKRLSDKIPYEAYIVQFAEEYHKNSMLKEGTTSINLQEYNKILMDSPDTMSRYKPTFVNNIKKLFT
ncbi:MAG: hypothetical protein HQK49_05845 [Oligoflexia bacterium]|nr:hypothetical protein [Oligoflexia bacterium]